MKLPRFIVKSDQDLDKASFIEFFNAKSSLISNYFPDIKSLDDIQSLIDDTYKNKIEGLTKTRDYIKSQIPYLEKVAIELSKIMERSWDGIEKITIIPAVCPISPRFIETNTFMVTYFYEKDTIFKICAHEMSHFLYFKKLKQIYPEEQIDTEYPSKDWLLSEIITPLLINDNAIQQYIGQKDAISNPDNDNILKVTKMSDKVSKLYIQRNNFSDFIKDSRNIITCVRL